MHCFSSRVTSWLTRTLRVGGFVLRRCIGASVIRPSHLGWPTQQQRRAQEAVAVVWPQPIPWDRHRQIKGKFCTIVGGVFERLLPKPLSGEVDELMQALVAGVLFEAVGNPRARPSVHGDVDNAGRIGLLEPRGRVELDREGVIGGVAVRLDHGRLPLCRSASQGLSRYGA